MISRIIIVVSGIWLSIIPWFLYAQNIVLTDYVTDITRTLSDEELVALNKQAHDFASSSWSQIATLIIPERWGRELYDIALETFRNNGIGQKDHNNGVLLVVALQEKKLRIMVWYWLEWALPDVFLKQLIEQEIRPLLNSWLLYQTVQTYQSQIIQAIQSESFAQTKEVSGDNGQFILGFIIWYRLLSLLTWWLKKSDMDKILHRPWSYLLWGGGIVWCIAAVSLGLLLGYIWFLIGWLLAALYRNPHVSSYGNDHHFYWWFGRGFGWGGWFGGFGWWFSWWGGAWD